jgi:membrane-associated phospholipid phosphatase
MNDKDKNLQHAMMSFALWGGLLVGQRQPRASERVVSHPSNFVPFKIDRKG